MNPLGWFTLTVSALCGVMALVNQRIGNPRMACFNAFAAGYGIGCVVVRVLG